MALRLSIVVACLYLAVVAEAQLVKMCLEDIFPSGHARSDPILSQSCASGHVHTFYGPQNFHPNTTYEDIRDTPPRFSTSQWVENQSLYWHPTVYEVLETADGKTTYVRAPTRATAYYRWDKSTVPATEAFPPGFRMIAHSSDEGAGRGEIGDEFNLFVECCRDGTRDCETFSYLHFPSMKCDLMEIFFSMPTCWDGVSLGDDNDHKSHMRYTTNGRVTGTCPEGFQRRLPQIELNINIGLGSYDGTTKSYELSDGANVYHVDFFNGWQEGKLQDIIDECPINDSDDPRNPPCACTPNLNENVDFLTKNTEVPGFVCDADVRRLIIDEAINITNVLPRGSCGGATLVAKSWDQLTDDLFGTCEHGHPEFKPSEDESGDKSGDQSEDESEAMSEDQSEDQSEDMSEDQSEDESEDVSGDASEEASQDASENESEDMSGDESEDESEDASESTSENESVDASEDVLEDELEDESVDTSDAPEAVSMVWKPLIRPLSRHIRRRI